MVSAVKVDPLDAASCVTTMVCSNQNFPATTSTLCSSSASYVVDMTTEFSSAPFVTVETYTSSGCASAALTSIKTYWADGDCHKKDSSTSYRAVRKPDGSSSIQLYADATCATTTDATVVTVAQENTCVGSTKVYGAGVTSSGTSSTVLSSTMLYDTDVANCRSPGIPIQVATAVVTDTACVASSTCSGAAAPFTGTLCSSALTYKDDLANAFGTYPYVIVEKYTAGQSCDATKLAGITAYVADGRCHKTGNTASFIATRALDGSAAVVTYTDSDMCATVSGVVLTVTAAQATGNSCASDANGVLDMRVYGGGATATVYSSIVSYGSFTGGCKPPAVPTQVVTTLESSSACKSTSACSGTSAPFTGFACTSILTYKTDMANLFGGTPHIIVERYAPGKSCYSGGLMSITTFLADSTCHKTGTSASYKATRKEDGAITINMFADSASCDTAGTTLAMTAAQVKGNSCASDGNGIPDTKVYSSGAAQQYLSTTMVYDTKMGDCKLPAVPTQLFSAVVDKKSCVSSNYCTGGSLPYNGTICTSTSSYQKDVAAVFGSNPYVIVEKYGSGKSCSAAALSSIGTYVADTKCHRSSSSTSFRAIRKADGSATIMTYAESGSCGRGPATLAVTAEQATSNSCASGSTGVVDAKLYGGGATPLFLTVTAVYSSNVNGCKLPSTPMMWVATPLSVDVCVPSAGCRYAGPLPTSTVCSSTRTYHEDVAVAFDWNPHVTVQKYISGKGCSESALSSVTTYLADGSCHSSSSFASFSATQRTDGSVMIEIYLDSMYCGTEGWKLTASAAQATSHACISTGFGDIKVSSIQK
ncbi:hypothetical protein PRIC1_001923 [Phytophthora ramorum]